MDQLVLHRVDRSALAARAVHGTACQLLELGKFNTDPHPGNYLCQVRGTSAIPVLLDFGNTLHLSARQRLNYCRLLAAISQWSVAGVRKELGDLGLTVTQSSEHPERDMEYMLTMLRDTGNRETNNAGMKEFMKRRKSQRNSDVDATGAKTKKERKAAKKQAARFPTSLPEEMLMFSRCIMLL